MEERGRDEVRWKGGEGPRRLGREGEGKRAQAQVLHIQDSVSVCGSIGTYLVRVHHIQNSKIALLKEIPQDSSWIQNEWVNPIAELQRSSNSVIKQQFLTGLDRQARLYVNSIRDPT